VCMWRLGVVRGGESNERGLHSVSWSLGRTTKTTKSMVDIETGHLQSAPRTGDEEPSRPPQSSAHRSKCRVAHQTTPYTNGAVPLPFASRAHKGSRAGAPRSERTLLCARPEHRCQNTPSSSQRASTALPLCSAPGDCTTSRRHLRGSRQGLASQALAGGTSRCSPRYTACTRMPHALILCSSHASRPRSARRGGRHPALRLSRPLTP
jgi:hypothetical protein